MAVRIQLTNPITDTFTAMELEEDNLRWDPVAARFSGFYSLVDAQGNRMRSKVFQTRQLSATARRQINKIILDDLQAQVAALAGTQQD